MYMRHLPLLEELFPDAQYVHLIRDGRDAALSFLQMPEGTFTRTWAHPTTPAQFACLWRKEVEDARALGRRRRRESLSRGALRVARRRSGGNRARDLRLRLAPVRAGDARLHGRSGRVREAASAAAPAASDHGRAQLARGHVSGGRGVVRGRRRNAALRPRLRRAVGDDRRPRERRSRAGGTPRD